MEVTIVFEDLHLFNHQKAVATRKSIRKSLKLNVTVRLLVYLFAIALGAVCIAFKLLWLGLALILVSTAIFYIVEFFKKAFHFEINFTKSDNLEQMVKEELFD